jgi:small nuclear ribonucleoprotein E
MYENTDTCVEGRIVGFDEYMNLVLDDAEEVVEKKQRRVSVGRILLKGDNITLMRNVTPKEK